jgi:hypothetical protein
VSILASGGAFAAGMMTSVGPCAAPRYLALATLCGGSSGRTRWLRAALFAAGIVLCYALIAEAAAAFGTLLHLSGWLYAIMACAFLLYGIRSLADTASGSACTHGAPLLAGSATALLLSPCCTPLLAFAAAAAAGGPIAAAANAAAFAAGHIAPLALVPLGLQVSRGNGALATVNGGLAIALAGYYGLLA